MRLQMDERDQTQKKALDAAFQAAEKAVATALMSAEKAVTKAEIAANSRFEAVNEFRGQLSDQAGLFMPRTEAMALFSALSDKLDAIDKRADKAEGRGDGLNAGWVYLLAGVAALGTIISIYLAVNGG